MTRRVHATRGRVRLGAPRSAAVDLAFPHYAHGYDFSACSRCGDRCFLTDDRGYLYRCAACGTLRREFRAKTGVLPP